MDKQTALLRAEAKMREADRWRDAYYRATGRWRIYRILYAARMFRFRRRLRVGSITPNAAASWQRLIDEACDMWIASRENVRTCAKELCQAELLAHIYYEEAEGRAAAEEEELMQEAG
jgi:hypothetical protein